jgi:hypothetical protein
MTESVRDRQDEGRAGLRKRGRELRDLLNEWDPVGAIRAGAPTDEYDCLVWPLMRRLGGGETMEALVAFLDGELTGHFGLSAADHGTQAFARRARAWHEGRRDGTTE